MPQKSQSLKKKAVSAVFWNATQRYGTLAISFISNIILARLLSPDDFGIVGLLTVFISLANVITESGFNSALIQKKDVTDIDYNTVFYWNLTMSLLLVILLYFSAPSIAKYFGRPALAPLLRVESIILVSNAFCIVQTTRLMKFLRFNILAVRNIIATLAATSVGIILAWQGFGVWSLVFQAIISSVVGAILLWSITDWQPSLQYDWSAFKRMFKFGAYISISSICNTLYVNLQAFIIGKSFSIDDLGYYSQAKKLETIPVEGTSSILNVVLFPIYSLIVEDRQRHIELVRKNIKVITFLTFPLMLLLILIAPFLFPVLFTNKWDDSIPMFQILCVFGMTSPLNSANVEIFRSIGEGKIYLILQTVKRIIGVAVILLFVRYGLYPMLWAIAAFGIISYLLNLIFTDKYFGYNYKNQIADMLPNLLLSVFIYVILYYTFHYLNISNNWVGLFSGTLIYTGIYLGMAYILKLSSVKLLQQLIQKR